MKTTACLLLHLLLLASTPAAAWRIADTDIPDTIQIAGDDTTLHLNGAGIREKFFVDVYIGALYLPAKTTDPDSILGTTGPASMHLYFLHKEVSRQKITDGWIDGLEANTTDSEMDALRPALDRFNRLFTTVRRGDVVRIDYRPETGTEVRINDEWRGVVDEEDFFRKLLRVWLGRRPASDDLKAGLLGAGMGR